MYREWPFFKVTCDMVEMVLAKGDLDLHRLYERELVSEELKSLGTTLEEKYQETASALLFVAGHDDLLRDVEDARRAAIGNGRLDWSHLLKSRLELREPYTMPLNVLQVFCLKQLRELEATGKGDQAFRPHLRHTKELMTLNPKDSDLQSAVEDALQITVKGIAAGMRNVRCPSLSSLALARALRAFLLLWVVRADWVIMLVFLLTFTMAPV